MGDAKLAKAPITLDAPAMTKASASNTENLRGIEAVVSVDRVSSSEGAEGPDILTTALWLVGSGADTTFGTAELEAVSVLELITRVAMRYSAKSAPRSTAGGVPSRRSAPARDDYTSAQRRSDSEAKLWLAYLARSMIERTSILPRRASGILEATSTAS